MPFQPCFSYTHSMVWNLGLIESARSVVEVLPLPPDRVLWLRQAARQRATRNSTRIEGNTLNSTEVGQAVVAVGRTQTEMQQEVRNYWRALEWFGVSATTAREWLDKWRDDGFVQPAKPGAQRVRNYLLTETWAKLLQDALRSARPKKP